jgi:hypothetical protein
MVPEILFRMLLLIVADLMDESRFPMRLIKLEFKEPNSVWLDV